MDKNLIIAILMTTLVILFFSSPIYQKMFGGGEPAKTVQTVPEPNKTESAPPVDRSGQPRTPGLSSSASDTTGAAQTADSPAAQTAIQINPPAEQTLVLENEDIRLVFNTRGGVITEAVMKRHTGPTDEAKAQLVSPGQTWYNGNIRDGDRIVPFTDIVFTNEKSSGERILLTAELTGGRTVSKEFTLGKTGYMLQTKTLLGGTWTDPRVTLSFHGALNNTEPDFRQIRIWPFSMMMPDEKNMYNQIVYMGEGDRIIKDNGKEKSKRILAKEGAQKVEPKKTTVGQDIFNGDLTWYSVKNKYFMLAAIPQGGARWKAESTYEQTPSGKWYDFSLESKATDGAVDLSLFIGPSSYRELKSYGHDLTQSMDLSWKILRPLAILFIWMFRQLHMIIPNWGVVLIVFSVIIKFALAPLSHSSMKSMKKMAKLQPKIAALKEKHKDNPQKIQQATMELYKQEGVNPFGGCLPMLLQMPVFFALYPVVGRAFELRQASFIPYWIEDLSRPDPFFILPIAMGISMYFQSKTTMTDPNQKAMLYMMPVMMIILFANFSAGLTLYWLMFNILSWAQQEFLKAK
ncbi:MAG: membrane protein insertase YidC [Candidatus Latescibacterota bacterium]